MAASAQSNQTTRSSKPIVASPLFENAPEQLKNLKIWVLWRYEYKDTRWTKPPYQPDGQYAKNNNPATWSAFDEVKAAYESGGYDGVGFVFDGESGLIGVDLDHMVKKGIISQRAKNIADNLDTYTEYSPSQEGFHCIAYSQPIFEESKRKSGDIEIYQSDVYFTFTGKKMEGYPDTIEYREEELKAIFQAYFPDKSHAHREGRETRTCEGLEDEEIIRLAETFKGDKFRQLMAGNWSGLGYPSSSEARLALYNYLAYYSGDYEQIARIFKRSGLYQADPDTCDRLMDREIQKAMSDCTGHYEPSSTDINDENTISEEDLEDISLVENPRLEVKLEPDNAIMRYIEYGKATCDAYPEYHYTMALVLLSTATNRNLVLRLAQGDVFPNIWAFNLGRSTISRKSAAAKKGENFASKTFSPESALPQSYSPEGLIEVLSKNPRGYLIKDEAAAMLEAMQKNYMLEMRDLYCILYDNQGYNRSLRSGKSRESRDFDIKDPFINMWCATTPALFRENTSLVDLTSGWLLRYLYTYPNYRKDWMAFKPATDNDFALYGEVTGRINSIYATFCDREQPIEIELSTEAWSYYQGWQEARERDLQAQPDDIELGMWGRLSFYALKLSMIFTVGRGDYQEGMQVSRVHIREACRQIDEYFLPTGKIVAEEVEHEESRNVQNRILGILKRKGGKIQWSNLLKNLHLKVKDVEEAVTALIESDEINILDVTQEKRKPIRWVVLRKVSKSS